MLRTAKINSMKTKKIIPVRSLSGEVALPGDKSISHRAVMLGAIARGQTTAKGLLDCDDCNYTIEAFRNMGISIEKDGDCTIVRGKGLKGLRGSSAAIDVGSSGTSMRVLTGILAGQNFKTVLKGDKFLSARPMKRVMEPLLLMGVDIKAAEGAHPPIRINGGKVLPLKYDMPVPSAQVKSAILFAGLYADGVTVVREAFTSRDHTERMMKYFGADITSDGTEVSLRGAKELDGRSMEIPGDISSASFFIAGALLLKGSRVKLKGVSINPTRAGILDILPRMGAKCRITNRRDNFEPYADIEIEGGSLKGTAIKAGEIPRVIDELPIIFVLAALAEGRTVIEGAEELKVKETDRITSMKENLAAMGARITGCTKEKHLMRDEEELNLKSKTTL